MKLKSLALLCLGLSPVLTQANIEYNVTKLGPGLKNKVIDNLATDFNTPKIKAYVFMKDALDLELFSGIKSQADKREMMLEGLKEFSDNDQLRIKDFLAEQKADNKVKHVQTIWINNVVILEANPATLYELTSFEEVERIHLDQAPNIAELVDYDLHKLQNAKYIAPRQDTLVDDEEVEGPDRKTMNEGLTYLDIPKVWEKLKVKGSGVVIANIDTGTDVNHPDLKNHIWKNEGEVPGNGIDDDENGYVDDVHGWDFQNNDGTVEDTSGHGTATSGILVGDGSNGMKTGVAPAAKVLILKANSMATYWQSQQYAMEQKVDIITSSLSIKWYFTPRPDYAAFRRITDAELAMGIIHINSSSNDGGRVTTRAKRPFNIATPGNIPSPWVHPDQKIKGGVSSIIGTANVDALTGVIAPSSPFGPSTWMNVKEVWTEYGYEIEEAFHDYPYDEKSGQMGLTKPDISGPGSNTTSTTPGGGYREFGGTSSATPHVAGVVALMLSANPKLTPAQVARILMTTATDLGEEGKDNRYGAGKVEPYKAVLEALKLKEYSEGRKR